MASKEKWLSLFEEVVGRKPNREEFMAGKAVDFKLTEIRRIAGLGEPTEIQTSFKTMVPTDDRVSEEGVALGESAEELTVSLEEGETKLVPEDDSLGPVEASLEERGEVELAEMPLDEGEVEPISPMPEEEAYEPGVTLSDDEPESIEAPFHQDEEIIPPIAFEVEQGHGELLKGTVETKTIKKIPTKGGKLKRVLLLLAILLIGLVTAGYFHFKSQTGPEVAVKEFVTAAERNDYGQVAKLLTNEEMKWDKNQAKAFMTYLKDQGIDLEDELDNLVESGAKTVYNDKNGNKLFSLNEVDKKFGIFPIYRVTTYPLELLVQTNLSDLTVNHKSVESGREVSLGNLPFTPNEVTIKATTALGPIDQKQPLDLANARDNRLVLTLETIKKPFKLNLSDDFPFSANMKLYINGKEQTELGASEQEVLLGQTLEIYAIIDYGGGSYTTDKHTVTITEDLEAIEVNLELPENLKEKFSLQAKDDEVEDEIEDFLLDYRDEINYSIENETNTFAKFYDHSSDVYREMVDYTEGGGARKAKVDHHIAGELTINNVSKSGDHYLVETYETFTQVYTNNSRDQVHKYKTYHLKPVGDSFAIYDIEVTTR